LAEKLFIDAKNQVRVLKVLQFKQIRVDVVEAFLELERLRLKVGVVDKFDPFLQTSKVVIVKFFPVDPVEFLVFYGDLSRVLLIIVFQVVLVCGVDFFELSGMFGLDLEVKRLILQNQRSVLFFS
jgi:hypothetical protein